MTLMTSSALKMYTMCKGETRVNLEDLNREIPLKIEILMCGMLLQEQIKKEELLITMDGEQSLLPGNPLNNNHSKESQQYQQIFQEQ